MRNSFLLMTVTILVLGCQSRSKHNHTQSVSFAWSGDLSGQNVCRDAKYGFPIFKAISAQRPQFFIGLGDMIYADDVCKKIGLFGNEQIPGNFRASFTKEDFDKHWSYNFADPHLQALLKKTPYYTVYDDHEVINDFGINDSERIDPLSGKKVKLVDPGFAAFGEFNHKLLNNEQTQSYFSVNKGPNLELFFLDTRKFRDHNALKDSPSRPKTMLGAEQLKWFKESLVKSKATWKVVVSSVPISIPTGSKNRRDGWANYKDQTGFENELKNILTHFKNHQIRNMIWITTDVHFATGFEYQPFPEDPEFVFYEYVTGPLSAGFFVKEDLDLTFHPKRLFLAGPMRSIQNYQEAMKWFNFGFIQITPNGELSVQVINTFSKSMFKRVHVAKKSGPEVSK